MSFVEGLSFNQRFHPLSEVAENGCAINRVSFNQRFYCIVTNSEVATPLVNGCGVSTPTDVLQVFPDLPVDF